MKITRFHFIIYISVFYYINCGSNSPKLNISNVEPSHAKSNISTSNENLAQIDTMKSDNKNNFAVSALDKKINNQNITKKNITDQSKTSNQITDSNKKDNPYSNYLRVKTVYELAMEANPTMFLPHDEFETANEYKNRVAEQVVMMKEIVKLTTQKSEIKKEKRLQISKEKELKRKSIIETLMTESSSSIEFKPTDIGRYDPENETFPLILFDTQYQITVPREEARTFKTNFESVKIKGIQQLKPKHDVKIKVPRAHIRSRPNGSIIGVASQNDQFEHIVDIDEWYKINFKGQFGFTHMNNAELKLIDIDNEYEYHDLVAIHPTTGSMYAMISIDKLVKAPLNLASRKYESGKPDSPGMNY